MCVGGGGGGGGGTASLKVGSHCQATSPGFGGCLILDQPLSLGVSDHRHLQSRLE